MIKQTMTYTDYNGKQVTEDFYFHLSKAELITMELSEKGGMEKVLERIIKEEDGKKLMELFKDLVLSAIGRKSDDGRRFIKNQEIRDDFAQTEAYSDLFILLASNSDEAAKWINGVMPAEVAAQIAEEAKKAKAEGTTPEIEESIPMPASNEIKVNEDKRPVWMRENRAPNKSELKKMGPAELRAAMAFKEQLKSMTAAQAQSPEDAEAERLRSEMLAEADD